MEAEKTRELIREAQDGDKEAMEKLLLANIKMVQKIANKYRHSGVEKEDLFQLASLGFVRAVQRFDLSTTYQFSTYAYPLIHNEIYKYLRVDGIIRTPRPIQKVERLMFKHQCVGKTVAEISEIIGEKDITLIEETIAHIHKGKVASLNKVTFRREGKEEVTLEDMVAGVDNDWDDNLIVKDALKVLDEREQFVIEQRYDKDMSQREVASQLGVSQAHVSRIEISAFKKMRGFLGIAEPVKEKRSKAKKKDAKKTGPKGTKGDREKALHLLKTSSLSYPDISEITGVPLGSMYKLGREHRPQAVKDMIKNRPTQIKGELNVYEA